MQKTKSWSLDSHPILHARNNKRLATTVYGAFDPIPEIADICEKHHIWLHIDVSHE